jgi:hypothetical protein
LRFIIRSIYIYYFLHASSEMSCHIIHRRWNVELKSLVNDNIVTVSEQNLTIT